MCLEVVWWLRLFEGDEGFGSGSVVGGPGGGFVLRAVFGCQGGGSSDSPQADDASSQALSVAYVRDFYPYASKKIDEPQGFSIDVVRDIADASGLECSFVGVDSPRPERRVRGAYTNNRHAICSRAF